MNIERVLASQNTMTNFKSLAVFTCRNFLVLLLSTDSLSAATTNQPLPKLHPNIPEMIEADGKLRLTFGDETLVVPRGLQPSMVCTRSGTLVVQAQIPEKPLPSSRMTYIYAAETRVSRDGGK